MLEAGKIAKGLEQVFDEGRIVMTDEWVGASAALGGYSWSAFVSRYQKRCKEETAVSTQQNHGWPGSSTPRIDR